MKVFRFLHYGLAAVLVLVGAEDADCRNIFRIPTAVMLGVVAGVILISIVDLRSVSRSRQRA